MSVISTQYLLQDLLAFGVLSPRDLLSPFSLKAEKRRNYSWILDFKSDRSCFVKQAALNKGDEIQMVRREIGLLKSPPQAIKFNVPKLIYADIINAAYCSEFIDAPNLADYVFTGPVDLKIIEDLGRLIRRLHGSPLPRHEAALPFGVNCFRDPQLIPRGPQSDILTMARESISLPDQTEFGDATSFIHGDLRPDNILCGLETPVVIDWELCGRGTPAWDLAFILSHLIGYGAEKNAQDPSVNSDDLPALMSAWLAHCKPVFNAIIQGYNRAEIITPLLKCVPICLTQAAMELDSNAPRVTKPAILLVQFAINISQTGENARQWFLS